MVSIIMTTYNEKEEWVKKAIDSILQQDYERIQIIIVHDNPSNKAILAFLMQEYEGDSRVTIISNDKNLGLALSLNRAIDACEGEYIARMDADDISFKDRLSKEVTFLKENPSFVGVGTNIQYINESGEILDIVANVETDFEKIKVGLANENLFKHPTMMFKTEFLKDIDGYRNINPAQDYELYTRAINSGYKITNIAEPLLYYRLRDSSISNSKALLQFIHSDYIRMLYINRKVFDETELRLFEEKMSAREKHFDKSQEYYLNALQDKQRGHIISFYWNIILASLLSKYRKESILTSLKNKLWR